MSSNDVKLKLQNIMMERGEKNVKMEPGKVVRDRDWLEKPQRCTELERSSLEAKLVMSERICEELDKRALWMEEEIEKLRREKLEVEEKLGKSEGRCAELDKKIIEMKEKMGKSCRKCGELKEKEIVAEELHQENNELRVKMMDAAQLYRTRMLKVKAKLADSAGSGGIGLSMRGGRKAAYNSGFAESKGTVEDDLGKKPEVRGASHPVSVKSRCTILVMDNIRKNLHKENLEIFENSCFGHLLKINNRLIFQGELMLQLLLRMDMVVSNNERLVFNINNSKIEFGPNDFDRITGLRFGTSEAITILSLSSIYEYVRQGRPKVTFTDVRKAFLAASYDNDGRGELTLKLALLYFLYGVLLSTDGHISKSELQYLHLIEDLQKFNTFPWGCVAHQFLIKSILSIRGRMDGLFKFTHKTYFVHGFSFALLTWAYEVMPSLATYCAFRANNFNNLAPRILFWSATKRVHFNCLEKFFTEGDKAHLVLQSTRTSLKKTITEVKCATPLSRPQPEERKMVCRKDQVSSTDPTYSMHHPSRNILRMELDELRVEKRKSDEHYRKRLEDIETRLQECAASVSAEEDKIVILADGKAQYGNSMSAEGYATCDHFDVSGGNGLLKKGLTRSDGEVSNPTRKMAAAEDVFMAIGDGDGECMDMAFGLTNKRKITEYCGEGSLINWTTKKKRSKASAPSPSPAPAPAAADCDSEYPLLQTVTAANDMDSTDSSDDESCSDAYMSNLVAMLQSKTMDV